MLLLLLLQALLDFSMSMPSTYPEDKGVDLFILEQALMTQHTDGPQLVRLGDHYVADSILL